MIDLEFLLEEDLIDIEESSFLSKLMLPFKIRKYNSEEGVSINDISDFIKHGYNPGFRKLIDKSTDIDELIYLRNDHRTLIPQLVTIKERIKLCKELGETNKTKNYYKGIKKIYIDKGITEKQVQKSIDECYITIDIINKRIKELK